MTIRSSYIIFFTLDITSTFPANLQHPFSTIILSCTTQNFIPISFHWYRNGTEIIDGQDFVTILTLGMTSQLTLTYTNYIDNSTYYRCLATNNISHVISDPSADGQVFEDWTVICKL